MKTELVQALTTTFEAYAQQTESGIEFWLARDLQHLLGYTKWDNFQNVVSKARTSCEVSGHVVSDHFADVGKTIAMPDVLAIVSMQGLQMLREAGLEPERDVTIRNMQNHSAAVNHVITGAVAAAIVSDRAIMQMPASTREQIKIAYAWDKAAAPGIVYMGSPDMPRDRLELIGKAIYEFARDTPEGVEMIKNMGYGGLTPMSAEELQPLAPYGLMLKEAMSRTP